MSEKKSEMVDLKNVPRQWAEDTVAEGPERWEAGDRIVYEACKRALRPEPPSGQLRRRFTVCPEGCKVSVYSSEVRGLSEWIEYVLANGWEAGE